MGAERSIGPFPQSIFPCNTWFFSSHIHNTCVTCHYLNTRDARNSQTPREMKREADNELAEGLPQKRKIVESVRHPLNEKGTSWVDTFQLPGPMQLSSRAFDRLWDSHPVEFGEIKIMGKTVKTPRWQQSYGIAYQFSGMLHKALPIPPEIQIYLDYANTLVEYLGMFKGAKFNMALVNWYENGNHFIGAHSDSEKQIVKNASGEVLVFSLSFGQKRELTLKPKKDVEGKELKIPMPNNSVVVMGGLCQRTHKHAVLKVGGQKGKNLGRRINVTLRMFVPT